VTAVGWLDAAAEIVAATASVTASVTAAVVNG
jgi:acyl-CoA hydrolase